jgi:hypothetical protein
VVIFVEMKKLNAFILVLVLVLPMAITTLVLLNNFSDPIGVVFNATEEEQNEENESENSLDSFCVEPLFPSVNYFTGNGTSVTSFSYLKNPQTIFKEVFSPPPEIG